MSVKDLISGLLEKEPSQRYDTSFMYMHMHEMLFFFILALSSLLDAGRSRLRGTQGARVCSRPKFGPRLGSVARGSHGATASALQGIPFVTATNGVSVPVRVCVLVYHP